MNEYVLGFCFTENAREVLLLKKEKPGHWQHGCINGIGGHIEPDETEVEAMVREFGEEAGVDTFKSDWEHTFTLAGRDREGEDWQVRMYRRFNDDIKNYEAHRCSEGLVHLGSVAGLPPGVLPNLRWLVPMHADRDLFNADFITKPCLPPRLRDDG